MNIIFCGGPLYADEMLEWTVRKGVSVLAVCSNENARYFLMKQMTKKLKVPLMNMDELEEWMMSHADEIDLFVSYSFDKKIKPNILSIPRYGCINLHPAILPDWKGRGGCNFAIWNRLSEWGTTAHYMSETFDTGSIIRIYKFNFDYRLETAYSLKQKTLSIQRELYQGVLLDVLEKGHLNAVQQKNIGCYKSKKDMLELMKLDIDALRKEKNLDLKIRVCWFPPYDGAGFEINGKFYTLINHEILESILPIENM